MKQVSQWRTVGVVLALAVLMFVALIVVRNTEKGPELLAELGWTFVILASVAAGKSAVEHLGKGGGIRGALRALFTEVAPSDPPAPPQAGGAP
jgi:hypothetical protein